MKNLIFIFLFWLSLTVIFAQSCCVAHNSSILNGDANVPSVTLKKKQAQIDLIGDNTWFKTVAIAQTNTHDHSHHTHQSTTPMQLKGSFSSSIQVRYGLTSRLTLHIQQPYTIIRTDSQNISGLADVNLLSTYQIFQNSKYSVGASLGLELPTGSSYQIVNNNYFILGSGSFDPLAGISATHKCNKWLFRLNVLYRQGMKGYDNFHFGSALSNQIWAFYPLIKKENSSFVWNVNGFLGQDWSAAHYQNNQIVENTGGYTLWSGVGTQVQLQKIILPITVVLPTYTQFRGTQAMPQTRLRIGVTVLL